MRHLTPAKQGAVIVHTNPKELKERGRLGGTEPA